MSISERPPIAGEFQAAAEHSVSGLKRRLTPPPFSLRLSKEEKQFLLREAGNMPLGAYLRSRLLKGSEGHRRTYRKPVKDEQALARILGELGRAKLANNLNQLAKAVNSGSLPRHVGN
jgi:hypothetical protein